MLTLDPILVISAHPDDEVLGCGGTLARLAGEGRKVFVAILGEGITSRYENQGEANASSIEALRRRSRESGEILGLQSILFHDLPDNRFDTVPLLTIVKLVENLIEELRPQVIYTHHGRDLNIDHEIVHRAVLTATRPIPGNSVAEIYTFESPSSTEWTFHQFAPVFRPNVFLNISGTLDLKLRALFCYETEIRSCPHPRSAEAITAIAQRWGSVAGFQAAEAFELIRALR